MYLATLLQVSLSGCTGPLDAVASYDPIALPRSWKDRYSVPDMTAWDILASHECVYRQSCWL